MSKITEYTRVNSYEQGDVLLIDGTNGTRTLPVEKAGIGLDPTFTQTGKAADAKETGDKLRELKSDLNEVENTLQTTNDISADTYIVNAIITTANTWQTASANTPRSLIIPLPEQARYVFIKAQDNVNAPYAFLTTNNVSQSQTPDYVTGTQRSVVLRGESSTIEIPQGAKFLYITKSYAGTVYTPESVKITEAKSVETSISSESEYIPTSDNVALKYIETSGKIASLIPDSKRLLVIPLNGIFKISVKIDISSTKRYGFCNSLDANAPVYNYAESTGTLDIVMQNTGYKYFVVQLFINSDSELDYNEYLANTTISIITATDPIARKEIEEFRNGFFHSESLKSLPILNSFSDINIDTTAYSDCAAFHTLMGTLCSNSNGFITQTLLGNDGHGNNLYKYVTAPKELKYDLPRTNAAPVVPISGGRNIEPLTVLITSNIHGREKNGNWVVYNLLSKLLNADTEMLKFFKNRIRFVCVPFICPSGNYENADGININRDFPTTYDGTCTSNEATIIKGVIDEYGESIFLHIDAHTFENDSTYANYVAGWIFTDSAKLSQRSVIAAEYVLDQYVEKYSTIAQLKKDYAGSVNIPTTCTYYTQNVYGALGATIEGISKMSGSPSESDEHTSAVAYLYDIITQTICSVVD